MHSIVGFFETFCGCRYRWQGCHNGRFWMKMSVWTSFSFRRPSGHPSRHPHLPADAVLPQRPCGRWNASARTWVFARTHLLPLPLSLSLLPSAVPASAPTRKKKLNLFILFLFFLFLVVVAGLERGKKISIFKFQFSVFGFQSPKSPKSPNSPNSPSSWSFAGEAARRRRFFRPSSPSHPSKLYSSLGWLNSKVRKPFPLFRLRLIDVDGF
jgi:hypothetical protein